MRTIENQILDHAALLGVFTADDLQNSLEGSLPLDRSRLNWYLAHMADAGSVVRIARGTYTVSDDRRAFAPEVSEQAQSRYKQFNADFPEIKLCVYEGPWLLQFMHHLASNQITYIEIEKDVAETVFHRLKNEGKEVYFRPDEEFIYNYVNLGSPAIFVKNLISESPLQTISGIKVPTLEKMLVDMYCDSDFFYLQGGEYHRIMRNARSRYTINITRMLRYARRRNVSEAIKTIYENSQYDID